jgi:membrane-associated phospholipid phosphatase
VSAPSLTGTRAAAAPRAQPLLRLAPIDRWTLAYVAVVSVVLAARWTQALPARGALAGAHVLMLVTVLLAATLRRRNPDAVLAAWYPLLFVSAFYNEIGILNTTRGVSYDSVVQSWDAALFGMQPSFAWIRIWPSPVLAWVLHLAYLSYYMLVLGAPLGLWLSHRRQGAELALLRIMATFYVCYTIFLLFPVAGPRYAFPLVVNDATAVVPARWAQRLLNAGASWGTAFPSSHVAVAVVAALAALSSWRLFGMILTVVAVLLTFGTVYGQFHYAVDALSGLALAVLMFVLTRPQSPTGVIVD